MLRFFQLPSDTLSFSAGVGGTATFTYTGRLVGDARCAIIGVHPHSTNNNFLSVVRLTRLACAGREYVQGSGVNLGLIAPGAAYEATGAAPSVDYGGGPFFPGNFLPLPNGQRCGGMMLLGKEDISIGLTQLAAASAISVLTLLCVEFPRKCKDKQTQEAVERLWARFSAGIGQVHFFGTDLAVLAGAAGSQTLNAQSNPPHNMPTKRLRLKGGANLTATGANDEDDFILATVLPRTDTERSSAGAAVPARSVVGHGSLDYPGCVEQDLNLRGRSLVDLQTAVVAADTTFHIAHQFEGRDPALDYVGAQKATA
jgi:hypothetical protein